MGPCIFATCEDDHSSGIFAILRVRIGETHIGNYVYFPINYRVSSGFHHRFPLHFWNSWNCRPSKEFLSILAMGADCRWLCIFRIFRMITFHELGISLKTNYHTRIVHSRFDTWTFQLHLMTPSQKMVVTYITPFLVWSRGRGDFGKIWGSARRGFDHFIFSSGLGRRFGARNSERPLAS